MTPTVGRIVWYCLDVGPNKGSARPGIVTRVWTDDSVQLTIFPEPNDQLPPVMQRSSAERFEFKGEMVAGKWCWPPRV